MLMLSTNTDMEKTARAGGAPTTAFSVGSVGAERQVQNVAAGVLSAVAGGTAAGTSGAGLYVYNSTNGNRNIVAVHNGNYASGKDDVNVGTRINKVNFHMICYWLDHVGTHIDGCP